MTFITPEFPPEAYTMANNWSRAKSMPAFAVVVEMTGLAEKLCRCKNCADLGMIYLRLPGRGPFPSPVAGGAITWFDGNERFGKGWYVIEQEQAFVCPACARKQPGGKR